MTNAPDRYERFVVPEGVKKCALLPHLRLLRGRACLLQSGCPDVRATCIVRRIAVEKDTKVADAAKFTLQREDHTIGNLVRM